MWRPPNNRSVRIDAIRVCVLLCVILFHVIRVLQFTYPDGALDNSTRIEILLWLASIFQNEILVFLYIFLRINNENLPKLRVQTTALIQFYLIWSLFYLLTSLFLENSSHIPDGTFVGTMLYIVLAGGAYYHLHFFSTIIAIGLLYNHLCSRMTITNILLAALITAGVRFLVEVFFFIGEPNISADSLLLLHILKVLSYAPFAFLAAEMQIRYWPSATTHIAPAQVAKSSGWTAFTVLIVSVVFAYFLFFGPFSIEIRLVLTKVVLRLVAIFGILFVSFSTVLDQRERTIGRGSGRVFSDVMLGMFVIHPFIINVGLAFQAPESDPDWYFVLIFYFIVVLTSLAIATLLQKILSARGTLK